jgi:hypothetical protein
MCHTRFQNMSLPPSLVQAAASNKTHLHQQALANLNMRESAMTVRAADVSITPRDNFSGNASILTPPQTPVATPWKAASNGSGLVVIPEPQKAESRHGSLNNRHSSSSSSSYSMSAHDSLANGSSASRNRFDKSPFPPKNRESL